MQIARRVQGSFNKMDGASALLCLALNVYFEARGESLPGQQAVALVTLNRAKFWKQDICTVVFSPAQFSWTTTHTTGGVLHREHHPAGNAWFNAKMVALQTLHQFTQGKDFTNGALYFHSHEIQPRWAAEKHCPYQIDNHIFYQEARLSK